jgi:hypothetical protein
MTDVASSNTASLSPGRGRLRRPSPSDGYNSGVNFLYLMPQVFLGNAKETV